MANPFVKAAKTQSKLRLAIDGPSGSGKTYTALVAATAMAEGGKIAVIDTERGSASLYADKFQYDVATLDSFNPGNYVELIKAAEEAGYAVIVIDSLSHAWEGEGGVLDQHDQATKRQKTQNSYTAWADVTPMHRELIDAMLQSKVHIIATMRSKMDYVQEKDERTGKTVIRKVGMAPVQRQGTEYEFTIVADMDVDHNLIVSKTRCDLIDNAVVNKPDARWFAKILEWLKTDTAPQTKPAFAPAATAPAPAPAKPMNGNGRGVVKSAFWDKVQKACAVTTPKGARLDSLDVEKLQLVLDKGNDEMKAAAKVLLAKTPAEGLAVWSDLVKEAKANGIDTPVLQPGIPVIDLVQTYAGLKTLLAADQEIPEEFW